MKALLYIFLIILFLSFIIEKYSPISPLDIAIKTLVRQASRWTTASMQDENSMIAVLHANYGAGYLWALKDIASENDIERASGIKLKTFEREIIKVQDRATKRMASLCPSYAPKRTYLSELGGE